MFAWWKVIGVALLMVLPGGFLLLAAYALTRAVKEAWTTAAVQAGAAGQNVTLHAVAANLRFRDTFRQMRASFTYNS